MHAKALLSLLLSFLLLASACGGNGTAEQALTPISGRVVAGPVAGADVTVLPLLNTGAVGEPLGSGTTDSQGFFSLHVSGYVGPAVVLARGGEYVDEATGNTIVAGDLELASLVVLTGAGERTVHVTAATTIAARRAVDLAMSPTIDALDALENGVAMVEEYYGIEGILTTLPADLTAGAVTPGVAAEYGALNAGFSQLAADRDIYLWSLVSALAQDGADGMFDGRFYGGPLYVEGPSGSGDLFSETGGASLRQSIEVFVGEPRNVSGLTIGDLSLDETIERHVEEDPDYSFCINEPRIDGLEPAVGPVGQPVELSLYGRFPDLDGVSLVVTFGGVPAEIVKGGEEELQVVAPASAVAGKVDVAVTCENTNVHGIAPKGFEYYVPNLVPAITDVTPDEGPEVGGTLIEVTGQDFDPTAIVEVGGTQAQTIARLGRTVLVVVAPAGVGTKDITVRQADTDAAAFAAVAGAFSYFGDGLGEQPAETSLDGHWKAYGLGHQYPDAAIVVDSDLVFGGGTFTQSANMWVATPDNPEGTSVPAGASGPFRVFADGTLWLEDLEGETVSRAFLSQGNDVFILANDASTGGPVWLGAGIRRASGMSNASLTGTWYLGLFSHVYGMGPDPRAVSSAWGTAEFDGAGRGSAGLVAAERAADPGSEDRREPMGSALAYDVAADGTFTVTIPEPDEGGEPIVFRGSLTQARDLGIAVSASGGRAQFLMMVPVPTGFGPPYIHGSWYGGGLAYEYEPYGRGNIFAGETVRSLLDGDSEGVTEVTVRVTSDAEENDGVNTEIHEGRTGCDITGLMIGGPDDLNGFVGASHRFTVFVPANLEAHPYADAVEFMGAALLVRRPAVFSSYTIDGAAYNAVGISTEYKTPGEPVSLDEEDTSFRTRLSFSADEIAYGDEGSDLVGRVREDAGARYEKTVRRSPGGDISVVQSDDSPEYRGPYAVFGDGRILMSTEPSYPELAASEEDMFEGVVGEIAGNADVILLRNHVNPDGASALIALTRDGTPTLGGAYNYGAFDLMVGTDWEAEQLYLGSMTLNPATHQVSANEAWLVFQQPNGQISRDTTSWIGSFAVSGGVVTSLGPSSSARTGIAAPDGSALFLVDLTNRPVTGLLVALGQPAGPVASAGSYRVAGFAHMYLTDTTMPVESVKEAGSGVWRITDRLDAGFVYDVRTNMHDHVNRESPLFADTDLAVNPDGSLSWPAGYSRGWLSANGRCAFLMSADLVDDVIYPAADARLRILNR